MWDDPLDKMIIIGFFIGQSKFFFQYIEKMIYGKFVRDQVQKKSNISQGEVNGKIRGSMQDITDYTYSFCI